MTIYCNSRMHGYAIQLLNHSILCENCIFKTEITLVCKRSHHTFVRFCCISSSNSDLLLRTMIHCKIIDNSLITPYNIRIIFIKTLLPNIVKVVKVRY